jgi:hypothetical protein
VFGAAAWAAMAGGQGAGDLAAPGRQPAPLDDIARFTGYSSDGHPGHVCPAADHHAGYVYTKHRYPRGVGGELSAVIHHGFSPMRVPSGTPDEQWITAPPSEVMF